MRYLIAGFGSIGRRHFHNLLTLGERDILLYHTHHSTLPDAELAGYPVEIDLRAALAHKPDAVIISNPTALHLDVAIPAAHFGCHLLIEKPISHSLARLDELKQAIDQNHNHVLVGFQFRFHPGLLQLKKLLDEGAITGDAVHFTINGRVATIVAGDPVWADQQQKRVNLSADAVVALALVSSPNDTLVTINRTIRLRIGIRNDGNGVDFYRVTATSSDTASRSGATQSLAPNPAMTTEKKRAAPGEK